ncbi:ABC transporter permease [Streptomyces sp. VRA16 Mangrove soil]|uniref:ABC transporter permease n=1 Tax=Streptomyces sp. VRA16 Mangrove soil TaxID=2817434 RepID=UPI001A9D5864|nr:ABC transporter permease [Streptomyces sp. VRA16 Mangrove soil]MBO1337526.1 ABC transporter permease [Streptomyces sp. VRA16 Mangrove soil]
MSAAAFSPRGGLTWTVLRLHRGTLWLWAAYVVLGAGVLLWAWGPGTSGLDITGTCDPAVAGGCTAKGPTADPYHYALTLTDGFLSLLPLAVAVFAGGALIGRELESGTAQLTWTQSVAPARWLLTKLALPALALVAGTGLLVVLRRQVAAAAPGLTDNRWFTGSFDALGPVAVVLPLLGLVCGALAALFQRRLLAGAALGFLLTAALAAALDLLRPYLWPTTTVTGTLAQGYRGFTGDVVDEGAITGSGAHIVDPICVNDQACITEHNITGYYTEGHPPSHFWPLQLVETGVVLVLTVIVTLIAFRVLGRRVAP